MGNQQCCSIRQKDKDINILDKKELALMVDILRFYSEQVIDTKGTDKLSQKSFEKMFIEVPYFAAKFFKHCQITSGCETAIPISLLTSIIEPFIKSYMNSLDLFELFCLVVLEKTQPHVIKSVKEFDRVYITYEQGSQIVQLIVQLFVGSSQKKIGLLDSRPTKSIIDGIFNHEKTLKYTYFVQQTEKQLPLLNQVLSGYFNLKFLQTSFQSMKIPKLQQESYVIGKEWLSLLALTHNDLCSSEEIQLTYSSVKSQFSYENFAQSLISTGEKSIIFLIYEEVQDHQNVSNTNKERYAFAGYNHYTWVQGGDDQEFTKNQIIYQLSPHFQVFNNDHLRKLNVYDESENPSFYFNFKRNKQAISGEERIGLGMGKDVCTQNYLFWVDQDITNQSYCVPFNGGGEESYLVKPFQLLLIEVWKYGGVQEPNIEQSSQRLTATNQKRVKHPEIIQANERSTWTSAKSLGGSPMLNKKKNLKVRFTGIDESQFYSSAQSLQTPTTQLPSDVVMLDSIKGDLNRSKSENTHQKSMSVHQQSSNDQLALSPCFGANKKKEVEYSFDQHLDSMKDKDKDEEQKNKERMSTSKRSGTIHKILVVEDIIESYKKSKT